MASLFPCALSSATLRSSPACSSSQPSSVASVACWGRAAPFVCAGGLRRKNRGAVRVRSVEEAHATAPTEVEGGPNIPCDSCKGKGWLICDFCEGEKVNIQTKNNRIYRRCPSCRAVGVVICPRCKVFKCVSFPDAADDNIGT